MLIGTLLTMMPDVQVYIDNKPLNQAIIAKYLCMFIDSNLKWDDHINKLVPKVLAKIGILRTLRKIVPIHTLKQLYTAIVQPHFDYGDMVYDSESGTNKTRLQKLQTRAVRLTTGSDPRIRRVSMFKELSWLSLQYRRDFYKCIIYKCRNGLAPQYLCDLFNSNDSMHSYNIRNSSQFWATKSCTAYYHRSFTVSGLNLWNNLLRNIQESTSLSRFKHALCMFIGAKPQF